MNEEWYITNPKGHVWSIDEEGGKVNIFAMSEGFHNGPICVNCGYSFCEHCKTDIPECQFLNRIC